MVPRAKPNKLKLSLNDYRDLEREDGWKPWHEHFMAVAFAQGLDDVLDLHRPPPPPEDPGYENYVHQSRFVFLVFFTKIKTYQGKNVVLRYKFAMDGRATLIALRVHYRTSTTATINTDTLLQKIHTDVLDGSWKKSYVHWIIMFERHVETFNENVSDEAVRLTEAQVKSILQKAVGNIAALQKVKANELEQRVRGNPPLSLQQYLALLYNAASIADERRTSPNTSRYAHLTEVLEDDPEETPIEDESTGYDIHRTTRGATDPARPRLPESIFKGLSGDQRKQWISLDDDLKRALLGASGPARNVNVTDLTADTEDVPENSSPDELEVHATATEPTTRSVHQADSETALTKAQAKSKAKSDAHPGDVRRLLANTTQIQLNTAVRGVASSPCSSPYATGGDTSKILPSAYQVTATQVDCYNWQTVDGHDSDSGSDSSSYGSVPDAYHPPLDDGYSSESSSESEADF